ncbi:Beta propeller domain protein [Posidoniimonas polymericola]|uniref:Beta propeller domain protein n=2 Tax=Posidoniimonas polymericola TaxID=2528002 RepID=A0A5C5YSF3_9BACT|nr:Beta propeller domain protein [Posidoniimonas polymericola]
MSGDAGLVVTAAVDVDDSAGVVLGDQQPATAESTTLNSREEVRAWLTAEIDRRYGELFGQTWENAWIVCGDFDLVATPVLFAANDSFLRTAVTNTASFSTTNVQVEGVDEADLVETDGKFVYIVSGKQLVIVDVRDPDSPQVASRVGLDSAPTGMYLSDGRLTLVSSSATAASTSGITLLGSWGYYGAGPTATTVDVIDISAPDQPALISRTEFAGQLVASRMVDGELRLVLREAPPHTALLPQPMLLNGSSGQTDVYVTSYTYESREAYLDRVLDAAVQQLAGGHRTFDGMGEVIQDTGETTWSTSDLLERIAGLNAFELSFTSYGESTVTVATIDTQAATPRVVDTHEFQADGQLTVYATEDDLYFFSSGGYVFSSDGRFTQSPTTIHKFSFAGKSGQIQLAATGELDGVPLNQFSIDEHDGYLRVVSSSATWNGDHQLTVFKQQGAKLVQVGEVDGLAPGEQVYSVRFLGERAFFVTFRQIDPLFAVDLSDPTDPQVMGELKLPGYSDYLQPIDENTLLAIGRGADENSGLFEELQVSLFDVTDLANPVLIDRYSFEGERSTATIATGNRWIRGDGDHHAVSYFADQGLLALPVHSESQHRFFGDQPVGGLNGLQLLRLDPESGITAETLLEHDQSIARSLRVGEHLIAVSEGRLTTHRFADLAGAPSGVSWNDQPTDELNFERNKSAAWAAAHADASVDDADDVDATLAEEDSLGSASHLHDQALRQLAQLSARRPLPTARPSTGPIPEASFAVDTVADAAPARPSVAPPWRGSVTARR